MIKFLMVYLGFFGSLQMLAAKPRFIFDEKKLHCVNAEGREGLNAFDPAEIFKDIHPDSRGQIWPARDAQCIDFSHVKFFEYLGPNYSILLDWDFRGSRFTHADLSFNFIKNGLFLGSTVEELEIGYGRATARDIKFDKGDMPMP